MPNASHLIAVMHRPRLLLKELAEVGLDPLHTAKPPAGSPAKCRPTVDSHAYSIHSVSRTNDSTSGHQKPVACAPMTLDTKSIWRTVWLWPCTVPYVNWNNEPVFELSFRVVMPASNTMRNTCSTLRPKPAAPLQQLQVSPTRCNFMHAFL